MLNPKGKALITHKMDMIFTHFGISGPAVLRCSQFVVKAIKKSSTKEVIDSLDISQIEKKSSVPTLSTLLKKEPKKSIKNILKG